MVKSTAVRKQAVAHEVKVTVSETKFNQTTEEKQLIQIRPFATDPAHICVKLGRTINLGNYESAKIDVSVDMPCYVEECQRVYREVMDFVQERLTEEVAKVNNSVEQTVEELL